MTARERPILFSAPMVRAILSGAKTQTRRIVKPQPPHDPQHDHVDAVGSLHRWWAGRLTLGKQHEARCPFGMPGTELWVRETFCDDWKDSRGIQYRADGGLDGDMTDAGCTWRPSIFMPRSASRITLEVTAVRVERLQDISESDAIAEGGTEAMRGWWTHEGLQWNDPGPNHRFGATPIDSYRVLWESINGPGSWGANPWVWAINFKRLA